MGRSELREIPQPAAQSAVRRSFTSLFVITVTLSSQHSSPTTRVSVQIQTHTIVTCYSARTSDHKNHFLRIVFFLKQCSVRTWYFYNGPIGGWSRRDSMFIDICTRRGWEWCEDVRRLVTRSPECDRTRLLAAILDPGPVRPSHSLLTINSSSNMYKHQLDLPTTLTLRLSNNTDTSPHVKMTIWFI